MILSEKAAQPMRAFVFLAGIAGLLFASAAHAD
jgi:hypothetical protein